MSDPAAQAQRIDKWLWHARFARTRGAAQELARSGHIRVNRDKVHDASRLVRVGDVLTLGLRRGTRVIRILGIAEHRDGFQVAQLLYEDAAAARSRSEDAVPSRPEADSNGLGRGGR